MRLTIILLLIISGIPAGAQWKGFIKKVSKTNADFIKREVIIELFFTSAIPTMYRPDATTDLNYTDDKGTGTSKDHYETTAGNCTCTGSGASQLHEVVIDKAAGTYSISAFALFPCKGGTDGDGSCAGESTADIGISEQPLGPNPNILSGTETVVRDIGVGTATVTITWHLERVIDALLIITPEDYDNWIPRPGRDELLKGGAMKVNLKVQKRNGQPAAIAVREFEVRLINTSREPGITINFPLSPRKPPLPDLRLIQHPLAESNKEDQSVTFQSRDGRTGIVHVGSYDGGGYTTLQAEAVLDGGLRIRGELLVPGGVNDVLIPKRDPGSIIATKWKSQYGNPADLFDQETSKGNFNDGDGLSAYEEYRGVFSLGQYRRLNPQKKELGILLKDRELGLFEEGIDKFQMASGILAVLFFQREIPENRRMNQNASSAHIFRQYALRMAKGNTSQPDLDGDVIEAWGIVFPKVGIPAEVTHVTIDVNRILGWYQSTVSTLGAAALPFNSGDLVASTTAHEIGHAVNVLHHGIKLPHFPGFTVPPDTIPRIRIFGFRGTPEILARPYTLTGYYDSPKSNQSGNVLCFMCYRNKTSWVRRIEPGNELHFYKIPLLHAGMLFCEDKMGTDINKNGKYFGDAIHGDCLGQIKLK